MDIEYFAEGPLLRIVFTAVMAGILVRSIFFVVAVIKKGVENRFMSLKTIVLFLRSFIPFHYGVVKKPFYGIIRYAFHLSLIIVPIGLNGHVALWEASRFEWSWSPLPTEWADNMTLFVIILSVYFILRRLIVKEIRTTSGYADYFLAGIVCLTFLTGYAVTHYTFEDVWFVGDHIYLLHILSGEAMLLTVAALFCTTRLDIRRCTGCASCTLKCPADALASRDDGEQRTILYAPGHCIHCGACVYTCPENAAELRHEINPLRLFRMAPWREIATAKIAICEKCGVQLMPMPQVNKIEETVPHPFIHLCSACKGKEMIQGL